MKILIIHYGALGDMLVATPALRGVREAYPDAKIVIVTNQLFPQIAPEGTLADSLVVCSNQQLKSLWFTYRLGRILAAQHFDLAINFRYPSERSALLTWLSRAKVRAGNGPPKWLWCYNRKLASPKWHYNELYRYRDLVEELNISVKNLQEYVFCSAEHEAFAAEFFRSLRPLDRGSRPTICIHPGASKPYRAWLPERYAEIGRRIVAERNVDLLITWADHERDSAEAVANAIGANVQLAPRTPTIGHLAALYKHCAMVICNNSGAMHVAVAAGVPVIALTGRTELEDWAPIGEMHRSVKSPLGGLPPSPESERKIMDALEVDAVWDAIRIRMLELTH